MCNFILQICLMIGFGGMVYMIARGVPRIDDRLEEEKKNKLDHWFSKIPIEKIDLALSRFLEKILRRLRVCLLRADNFLVSHLNKIKSTAQVNNKKTDLLQTLILKETDISQEIEKNNITEEMPEEVKEDSNQKELDEESINF